MPQLSGQQIQKFQTALQNAYPSRAVLEQMVRINLNQNLESIAGGDNLTEISFNLIVWAARNGRFNELLRAAVEGNPGNPALQSAVADLRRDVTDLADGVVLDLPDVPDEPRPISRALIYGGAVTLFAILALLVWVFFQTRDLSEAQRQERAQTATATATLTPVPTPTFTPTPIRMTGPIFNIAVAEFGNIEDENEPQASELGTDLSRLIYNGINDQIANATELGALASLALGDIQIWHLGEVKETIRVDKLFIPGETAESRSQSAQALARNINADMVIYGNLETADDPSTLMLEFYFDAPQLREQPDAVGGRHQLAQPIEYRSGSPGSVAIQIKDVLGLRSRILYWLVVGLTHDLNGAEEDALALFLHAEKMLADWREDDGKELLYYLIGRSALNLRDFEMAQSYFQKSAELQPNYANALMGSGSVAFDQGQLLLASMVELPAGVDECTSMEQISALLQEFEASDQNEQFLRELAHELSNTALGYFQQAVEAASSSDWPPLAEIARLNLGLGYSLRGQAGPETDALQDFEAAIDELEQARQFFAESGQIELLGHTYLGLGQAYFYMGNQLARQQSRENAADAMKVAFNYFSQCVGLDNGDGDSFWLKQKIITCGCDPYMEESKNYVKAEGGGSG